MDTIENQHLVHERCAPPKTVADTGVEFNSLLRLMMKTVYVRGLDTTSSLASALKLPLSVCNELLEAARERGLVEVLGSAGHSLHAEFRYGITTRGREWAVDALEQSLYVGPAPVSLQDFHLQIGRQRLTEEQVVREVIVEGLSELVISNDMIRQLGPAINAGRSVLLYGAPGNGKTTIAEIMGDVFKDVIHVPYAVDVDGQIIKVFDPNLHVAVEETESNVLLNPSEQDLRAENIDRRWVACKRPCAISGGELNLSMLDLSFNPYSRFYEAPLHMKAIGGTFVIDDLGRQLIRPEDLLNRWIGPMEKRIDYLTLNTGRTFEMPFDVLLVFSTNLLPEDIMDPAFLRRIPYKIGVGAPSPEEFMLTLQQECTLAGVFYEEPMARFMMNHIQSEYTMPLAFYQPKFIVHHIVQTSQFEGHEPELNTETVTEAMRHLAPRSNLIGMSPTPKSIRAASDSQIPPA